MIWPLLPLRPLVQNDLVVVRIEVGKRPVRKNDPQTKPPLRHLFNSLPRKLVKPHHTLNFRNDHNANIVFQMTQGCKDNA